MPHLEPTYLRYIYDSLIEGSIHPENAAELPDGLIGLYEDAFNERNAVFERQKLLKRFAIWALLKKEVSAAFVAEVLSEPEADILNFISTYSAWFNSPESGKYQLYHERLKLYLLQKMSEGEIYGLHEKLISRLEQAIKEQKADEFEWYGLEFLAGHLSVAAMLNGDGKRLIDLAYSQTHWQRQLKISKGYSWTNNGLKEVMTWASKYNDDEVIECGLQMVDLHHQEQNAAPQIVALVAEGDFDSALKRIEQFGGNDKEGLQRKFILYMLCLMELTLLDSKDKPFRREGIEKLLKHLDEQLPVDHSLLNWNDFFSSYLMFQLACEWDECGLDYLLIYSRTDGWYSDWDDWLGKNGPYSRQQFHILEVCAKQMVNEYSQSVCIRVIAIEMVKQGYIDESVKLTSIFDDDSLKNECIESIVVQIAKQGDLSKSLLTLDLINEDSYKCTALASISTQQWLFFDKATSSNLMNKASDIAQSEDYDFNKIRIFTQISTELARQQDLLQAKKMMTLSIEIAKKSIHEGLKSYAYSKISLEYANQGLVNECIKISYFINEDNQRRLNLMESSIALASEGFFSESINLVQLISSEWHQSWTLRIISVIMADRGKFSLSLQTARSIIDTSITISTLVKIAGILIKNKYETHYQSVISEAFELVQLNKNEYLRSIAFEMDTLGNLSKAHNYILQSIEYTNEMSVQNKIKALNSIVFNMKSKEFELFSPTISAIAIQIILHLGSNKSYFKITLLLDLSRIFFEKKNIIESERIIRIALDIAKLITIEYVKDKAFYDIGTEMVRQSIFNDSIEYSKEIVSESARCSLLAKISTELVKNQSLEKSEKLMAEAIKIENGINGDDWVSKSTALESISVAYIQRGELEKSIDYAKRIPVQSDKSSVLAKISTKVYSDFNISKSKLILEESIELARSESDNSLKSDAMMAICIELAKQGNLVESDSLSSEIPLADIRNKCFEEIGNMIFNSYGLMETIKFCKSISSYQNRLSFKIGIIHAYHKTQIGKEISLYFIKDRNVQISELKHLLQFYALNQIFFEDIPEEKIQRFNRTLNIQWAIDIKNQLPN
ncbi:MAG: hypothetical protein ACK49D_10635 [Flavobacteriia bacterium]